MKATAKDLRFHSKEILASVARGEEVIITYRGKPRAKIVPVDLPDKSCKSNNSFFGIWKDNRTAKDVNKYMKNLRKGRF